MSEPKNLRTAVRRLLGSLPTSSAEIRRELVVVAEPEAKLRAFDGILKSVENVDTTALEKLIKATGIAIYPLFGLTEERLKTRTEAIAAETGLVPPDLSIFYKVDAPNELLETIADQLRQLDIIQAAYIKPPAEPPMMVQDLSPIAAAPPSITPDFTVRQQYLDAAPGGIDARFACPYRVGVAWAYE